MSMTRASNRNPEATEATDRERVITRRAVPVARLALSSLGTGLGLVSALGCSHQVESPSVTLVGVQPDVICSEQFPAGGLDVAVRGTAFTPLPLKVLEEPTGVELPTLALTATHNLDGSAASQQRIEFSGQTGGVNAERLTWTSTEEMHVSVDQSLGIAPGVYSLTLTNPDRESSATREAAVAVVPPPRIDSVQPDALCNGFQEQRLILNGANFIAIDGVGPSVSFTPSAGAALQYDAATVDGTCAEVPGLARSVRLCTSISVTIPASTLPEDTYTLSVSHPAPVGCTSTESPSINVLDDGPVVFFMDPPVAYDGINTRATLFMTSVAEPFTVSLAPAGQPTTLTQLDASIVSGTANRIQATVPVGQAPGTYDVIVNDSTGCQTVLRDGLTVTSDLSVDMGTVADPFGYNAQSTPVTIFREGGSEFAATPRAFLNPSAGSADDVAIQLSSVAWVNADELTAVVPEGAPVGSYDLVVVNPDGSVGVLEDAFSSLGVRPPVVSDVLPQSIVNQTGQSVVVSGENFSSSSVSLRCRTLAGTDLATPPSVTTSAETCDGQRCSVTATIDGSALAPGDVCVVRVANADGSYGEFSALGTSNSSYNLATPVAGRPLLEPRRALVAAAVKATSASRFLYAIGGDDGNGGAPLGSIEYSPVNVFGTMSDFALSRQALGTPRTEHAGTQLGRYIYVLGGSDGDAALASGERALVLSPEESPAIDDLDLCLSQSDPPCFSNATLGGGLPAGEYSYRVAALIDPTDPQNLGGETLASDPLPLKLPSVQERGILVRLLWSAPRDALGAELTGITGYRVYRTPADGVAGRDEVLLAEILDPAARSFVDDGTQALGPAAPLPPGSTSAWQALPSLGSARVGLSAAVAADPDTDDLFHLYALLGDGLATYEHLPITVLPNGRQTLGNSWTTGTETSAVARTEFGTWVVTDVVSSQIPAGRTYLYLGGGLAGASADGRVEAALVEAGGELAAFSDDPTASDIIGDFSSTRTGYGTACAAGRLFLFGGQASQIRADATAAEIVGPSSPELANNSWNNEGLTMTSARYRMGSTIQSAFIFLVGGETGASGATSSTELVIW